jgi:hypothetical protein
MTTTSADIENIWLSACKAKEHPIPADFGDADRYVFLGPEFYTGLRVVSRVYRERMTDLTPEAAITVIQEEATNPQNARWNLLGNEHWCLTALGAALDTAEFARQETEA